MTHLENLEAQVALAKAVKDELAIEATQNSMGLTKAGAPAAYRLACQAYDAAVDALEAAEDAAGL